MRLSLNLRGVDRDPALNRLLEGKLRTAFDQFGRWIRGVAVAIEDVNGPKGGVDKCCRVSITVPRHPGVVVEGRGTDLFAVISEVLDRASVTMSRLHDRRIARRRGSMGWA
jgi:putative sigma-54 modulation protein